MTRVLFVCLGNICRSAAAHGIMQHLIESEGLGREIVVDSAGTYSGHQGQLPDPRMRKHASRRGYELTHRARPVRYSDFDHFDLIVAMDDSNFYDLCSLAPTVESERKLRRMRDYLSSYREAGQGSGRGSLPCIDHIPDPYYSGSDGFELVLDLLEDSCRNLLNDISLHNHGLR